MILLAAMTSGLLGSVSSPAQALGIPIPESESNLFILDVSGSVNSVELWKNLKISIVSKLQQPFGSPILKDGKPTYPADISVTAVSKNSANSPIFTIVDKRDSKEIWGAVDLAFPRSNKSRWEKFDLGLFGDKGVWIDLIKIFEEPKLIFHHLTQDHRNRLLLIGLRFTVCQHLLQMAVLSCPANIMPARGQSY